jgi:hypothetical protein
MRKMGLFWFAAALLGAALIFAGCETEADTETVTVTNNVAGDVTGLQKLLEEGATPIRYIDDLEINGELVAIPQGITVNVEGGVTVNGGFLGVAGTLNFEGTTITATSGTVAADATFIPKVTGSATKLTFAEISATGTLAFTGTEAAVRGDVTIGVTGSSTVISASGLSSNTLYVVGNLTVDEAISTAATLYVLGNATVSTAATFTGPATFGGAATFGGTANFGGAATFNGLAVFSGDVTLTAAPATFNDSAFVASGKKITLTDPASVIKLAKGKSLGVGIPAPNVPYPFYEVIGNKADSSTSLTLTPAADTVLTFDSGKGITQSGAANGISIDGTAGLTAGATYTVASDGTLTLATNATLTLYAGYLATETGGSIPEAKLILTGHATTGAKLVV